MEKKVSGGMIKATTKNGSHYIINGSYWLKIKNERVQDGWWYLYNMKVNVVEPSDPGFNFPWKTPEAWEDSEPVVGKHLYIAGRETWWITTPIVSVEEITDEDLKDLTQSLED